MAKRSKRELIDTGRNKVSAKRDVHGRAREKDDAEQSPARSRTAKTKCGPPGQR